MQIIIYNYLKRFRGINENNYGNTPALKEKIIDGLRTSCVKMLRLGTSDSVSICSSVNVLPAK